MEISGHTDGLAIIQLRFFSCVFVHATPSFEERHPKDEKVNRGRGGMCESQDITETHRHTHFHFGTQHFGKVAVILNPV